MASWAKWLKIRGCRFYLVQLPSLKLRFRPCFEQGVPSHWGNYRVWIHSKTRTWHVKNIQLVDYLLISFFHGAINLPPLVNMSEGHFARTKMIPNVSSNQNPVYLVRNYYSILLKRNLFKILPWKIIDNLNKTTLVTMEPETVVSKVRDTVVPNRRQLCHDGGIGYQQKCLTATGHEHTTLAFSLNLYVKVINAQKKSFPLRIS